MSLIEQKTPLYIPRSKLATYDFSQVPTGTIVKIVDDEGINQDDLSQSLRNSLSNKFIHHLHITTSDSTTINVGILTDFTTLITMQNYVSLLNPVGITGSYTLWTPLYSSKSGDNSISIYKLYATSSDGLKLIGLSINDLVKTVFTATNITDTVEV